jgi:hypothetical protein
MKLAPVGQRDEHVEYQGKDAEDEETKERRSNEQQNGQRFATSRPADHFGTSHLLE